MNIYDTCRAGKCVCVYDIAGIKSQLRPCRFASIILDPKLGVSDSYLDLLWYITDGCPIVDSDVESYECQNYLSITEEKNRKKIDDIIEREVGEGMISLVEGKPQCVHALGAVPKSTGGIRQITDCSRPLGRSVNDHCESLLEDFSFKNVDYVVEFLEGNEFMTVIDIKAAYRAVPIRAEHRKYQGFSWVYKGVKSWFVENRLCFGLLLGPMYFNYLSTFVYDVLTARGLKIVNYLDNFLAVSSDLVACLKAQHELVTFIRFLGFHVAFDKIIQPSTCVTYLGIEIDSISMELRLPEGKLSRLMDLLTSTLSRNRISKKELESLGGLLSHCSHVVKGGRTFCKSVYMLYRVMIKSNKRFVDISSAVKDDLKWWLNLGKYFNGVSKIVKSTYEHPMISDSSLKGFGVFLGCDWCAGTWDDQDFILLSSLCNHIVSRPISEEFDMSNINVLEFWPVLLGIKRWAHLFVNKKVVVYTDNTQVMFMLINGGSSNPTCMHWLRELFWICAIYNIELIPKYINTKCNVIADTLSRIPYVDVSSKLEELLHNSNLCCLTELFNNYRGRPR